MKNVFKLIGIIALAAVIGFSLATCDNGTGGGGGGGGGNPTSATYTGYDSAGKAYKLVISKNAQGNSERDSRLVNADNEAWVNDQPVGHRDGIIFKADGTFQEIDDYSHPLEIWGHYQTGSWTTSGDNRLTLLNDPRWPAACPYTVTSTTLTFVGSPGALTNTTKMAVTLGGPRSAAGPAAGNPGRAAYAPQSGDAYELTYGTLISTGFVYEIPGGGEIILKPSNAANTATFTVTFSGSGITSITGTITWSTGVTDPAPGNLPIPPGTFTLTGIPAQHNGKIVNFGGPLNGSDVLSGGSLFDSILISNGRVDIPVWVIPGNGSIYNAVGYNGNDTVEAITITILDPDNPSSKTTSVLFMSVKFSNGGASRSWNAGYVVEM
ncbi:MAG: hypothetical protein LBB72_03435 [Spirochaetaceae bacterium]|jgi:hypothetical protein|nr:hypothetical protein [Spirochaetaceae bacterium]